MSRNVTRWPEATIGEHIYEPIVIAQLRREGFVCRELRSILIPATHASAASLASAPRFQKRCKRYIAQGLYPVFEPTRRELVLYRPKKKTRGKVGKRH